MELRPGYKQTEIGVIPEDWEVTTLEHAVVFLDGRRRPIKESDRARMRGIFPYYGASGVIDYVNDYLFDEELILLGEDGENILSRNVPLAFRIAGKTWVNNHAHVLRPSADFDIRFLTDWLESLDYSHLNSGTAQPKLNRQSCLTIPVVRPPLLEQQAIADVLSDMDATIGALSRLIAKKRDLRQGAMQRLLTGQTRLPGFSAPWQVKRLGELGEIRSGGTPATSESSFWNGGIPWCTPTDITALSGKKYLVATARTISERGLAASAAEILPPRSLIMTSRATIGECAINMVPMATNQGFKNIVPSEEVDVEFLYYLMGMQKSRLIALCSGSTFLEISKRQLEHFEVCLPSSKSEQTAVARILSDMDAEMNALEARLIKTRALKQAMMQALLTGRVRLPIQSNAAPETREYEHA